MSALIANQLQPDALACFLERVCTEGTQTAKLVCIVAGQGPSWLVQSSSARHCRGPPRDRTLPFCQDVPRPPDPSTATTFPASKNVGSRCTFLATASAGLAAGKCSHSASEKAPCTGGHPASVPWSRRTKCPEGRVSSTGPGRVFFTLSAHASFEADPGRPDDSILAEWDPPRLGFSFSASAALPLRTAFSKCLTMMESRSLPLCARPWSTVRLTLRSKTFNSLRYCF